MGKFSMKMLRFRSSTYFPLFRRTYAVSVDFKVKRLKKVFFCVKPKTVKFAERSSRSFPVYLMNRLFQASIAFNSNKVRLFEGSFFREGVSIWSPLHISRRSNRFMAKNTGHQFLCNKEMSKKQKIDEHS